MRRPERVAELVREEILQIVGYELDDPRLLGVTITDVRMADNLRDAKIFVTVSGTEEEIHQAMKALQHATTYVRRQLAFALELRHAPLLHFVRDTVEERAARVDALLADMTIEKPESETANAAESAMNEKGETPRTN